MPLGSASDYPYMMNVAQPSKNQPSKVIATLPEEFGDTVSGGGSVSDAVALLPVGDGEIRVPVSDGSSVEASPAPPLSEGCGSGADGSAVVSGADCPGSHPRVSSGGTMV